MNKNVGPLIENISEATVACLFTMVQGNMFAIGVGHLIIASKTGITAGLAATIAILLANPQKRGLIALILGLATTVGDYLIHPGMFGSIFTEAIVTGVCAALLSLGVGAVLGMIHGRVK